MIFGTPNIVTNGLAFYLDAGNRQSYAGSGSTTWNDLTGKGASTITGTPAFSNNNAGYITFNGSSNYVTTPAVALGTTFSIEIWVNLTDRNSRVWITSTVGGGGYLFNFLNGLIYNFAAAVIITPSPSIAANQWYHIVGTKSGTVFSAYINGIFNSQASIGASSTVTLGYIGALTTNGSTFSNYGAGRLSQVRAYTRALSQQEVFQNYNATKARFGL